MGTSTAVRLKNHERPGFELKIARPDEASDSAEQAAVALEALNLEKLNAHLLVEGLKIPEDSLRPDRIRESMACDRSHSLRDFAACLTTDEVVSLTSLNRTLDWTHLPAQVRESKVHGQALRQTLLRIADALPEMASADPTKANLTARQQIESWLEQLPKLYQTSIDEFTGYKTIGAYLDKGKKRSDNSPSTRWEEQLGSLLMDPGDRLLPAPTEQLLFKNLQFAVYEFTTSAQKVLTGSPSKENLRTLEPLLDQVNQLINQVAKSNMGLVFAMIKRCKIDSLDPEELQSEGSAALLRAVNTFNPWLGFRFSTYACRAILKAFSRVGMKQSKYQSLQKNGMTDNFDEFNEGRIDSEAVDGGLAQQADIISSVRQAIPLADLNEVELRVLNMRTQLNGSDNVLTLEEAGRIIGVTKERVRQIQNRAFSKIRQVYEEYFLN